MAISFPLSLPTTKQLARIVIRRGARVAQSESIFTKSRQVYAHQGEWWEMDCYLPPMKRADAEPWVAFLVSLNGLEGSFLAGDPTGATPRGTWSGGSPILLGAHAAGVKTLSIAGVEGLTWKAGDWLQIGTGSSSRLHKAVQDGSQTGGSPTVAGTLEIWPRTRSAYVNGQAFVVSSAKGVWRLRDDVQDWSIERAKNYGIQFSAVEDL